LVRRGSSAVWALIRVREARIIIEGTSGVIVLVGQLHHLLTNEIVSMVTNAAICGPVVGGVSWANSTYSTDFNVSSLAEAAIFEPIFVESALWSHKGCAGLLDWIINLVHFAL
jgi:hypothetical protein